MFLCLRNQKRGQYVSAAQPQRDVLEFQYFSGLHLKVLISNAALNIMDSFQPEQQAVTVKVPSALNRYIISPPYLRCVAANVCLNHLSRALPSLQCGLHPEPAHRIQLFYQSRCQVNQEQQLNCCQSNWRWNFSY